MTTPNLEYIAEIVAELYSKDHVKNFVPLLGKGGRKRDPQAPSSTAVNKFFGRSSGINSNNSNKAKNAEEIHDIYSWRINYELTEITGKTPLDQLLRTAILSKVPVEKKVTQNGMERDELKKAITILRAQINNLIANNANSQNDNNLLKNQEYLSRLEELYLERLEIGNFEEEKDFCAIALKALKILDKDDETSKKLYVLIAKKLGVTPRKVYTNERPVYHNAMNNQTPTFNGQPRVENAMNNQTPTFNGQPRVENAMTIEYDRRRNFNNNNNTGNYSQSFAQRGPANQGYRPGDSWQNNHKNFVRNENDVQAYVPPSARITKANEKKKVYDFPDL